MAASEGNGVLAVYKYLDDFTNAIETLRGRSNFNDYQFFSPTSYHEIEHACHFKPSPVRFFTLIGALTGTTLGFALPLVTDFDWPIVVGGKTAGFPSLPAYVVIGFELTILLGAISTIVGMLVMGRVPNPKTTILDKRLSNDHFGIFLPRAVLGGPEAKELESFGAVDIKAVGDAV